MFEELDNIEAQGAWSPVALSSVLSSVTDLCLSISRSCPGLDCTGRLFISDRAHLVMGFHQIVDGLKELELGGKR